MTDPIELRHGQIVMIDGIEFMFTGRITPDKTAPFIEPDGGPCPIPPPSEEEWPLNRAGFGYIGKRWTQRQQEQDATNRRMRATLDEVIRPGWRVPSDYENTGTEKADCEGKEAMGGRSNRPVSSRARVRDDLERIVLDAQPISHAPEEVVDAILDRLKRAAHSFGSAPCERAFDWLSVL